MGAGELAPEAGVPGGPGTLEPRQRGRGELFLLEVYIARFHTL